MPITLGEMPRPDEEKVVVLVDRLIRRQARVGNALGNVHGTFTQMGLDRFVFVRTEHDDPVENLAELNLQAEENRSLTLARALLAPVPASRSSCWVNRCRHEIDHFHNPPTGQVEPASASGAVKV